MVKKIYLSLDDLNKLYGISPAIINAIKKKRRKRRIKKLKINNGTMGDKPSPSGQMVGSSSALAVATQQLNQSSINKRIEDINRNNLLLENKKDNLMIEDKKQDKKEDIPIVIQNIYNKLINKEVLSPDELVEFEKIQNMMFPQQQPKAKKKYIRGRKSYPFNDESEITTNPLASTTSNVMGRTENYNNIKISDNDNTTNATGTSSDNFISNAVEEYLPPLDQPVDIPIDESIVEENIDEENIDEENKVDTTIDQPEDTYMTLNDFDGVDGLDKLREIANTNNISYGKKINRRPLYNLLLKNNLIPLK